MATQVFELQSHEHVHEDNDDRLNTREAFNVTDDDQAPPDAVEAIPNGGDGWIVVAACATLLFWLNGYTTAWGVLQTNRYVT